MFLDLTILNLIHLVPYPSLSASPVCLHPPEQFLIRIEKIKYRPRISCKSNVYFMQESTRMAINWLDMWAAKFQEWICQGRNYNLLLQGFSITRYGCSERDLIKAAKTDLQNKCNTNLWSSDTNKHLRTWLLLKQVSLILKLNYHVQFFCKEL